MYEFHASRPYTFEIPIEYAWLIELVFLLTESVPKTSFRVIMVSLCTEKPLKFGYPFLAPTTNGMPKNISSTFVPADRSAGFASSRNGGGVPTMFAFVT